MLKVVSVPMFMELKPEAAAFSPAAAAPLVATPAKPEPKPSRPKINCPAAALPLKLPPPIEASPR